MKKARLKLTTIEHLWKDKVNKTTRNEIRKALKNPDLEVWWKKSEEIVKLAFYPLYLQAMKRFGTPPHSLGYFLKLIKEPDTRLVWGEYKGKPIAVIFGWEKNKEMTIGYAPSNPQFWWTKINNLLYWEFIKQAVKEKCEYVNFGTARYKGQIEFKKKWSCEIYEDDEKGIDPDRWFYKILRFLWKTFVPLKLTPYLGKLFRG